MEVIFTLSRSSVILILQSSCTKEKRYHRFDVIICLKNTKAEHVRVLKVYSHILLQPDVV